MSCLICDKSEKPCCRLGSCEAPKNARGITSCIHCGGELIQVGGFWYHHSQFYDDGSLIQGTEPQDTVIKDKEG